MSNVDPAVMKLGQESYALCMACHGPTGDGVPNLAPPLAGSEWVLGPSENLVRMMFRGLVGPIKVKGEEWNLVMAPNAPMLQTDEKIAAVLTYVRNSWGNEASAVTVADVAPWRKEIGQPMLNASELINPLEGGAPEDGAVTAPEEVVEVLDPNSQAIAEKITEEIGVAEEMPSVLEDYTSGVSPAAVGIGLWLALCIVPVLVGFTSRK